MEKGTVSNLSVTYNMSLITVNKADFSKVQEIIKALSEINIIMITLSQSAKDSSSLTFAVEDTVADAAVSALKKIIPGVYDIIPDNVKITMHGSGFKNVSSGVNDILDMIAMRNCEIKLFAISDTEFSVIIDKANVDEIVSIFNGRF